MGLFDKLFGPPDRDKFAKLVMDAMRRTGQSGEIRYDREQFCIRPKGEATWIANLHNAHDEYCAAPRSRRQDVLNQTIQAWLSQFHELPDNFQDLQPDLLPVVRPRSYYELVTLQGSIEGRDVPTPSHQVLAEHLGIGLVYDRQAAMQYITQDNLDEWGVTLYEGLEAARENLKQLEHPFVAPPEGPGLYLSAAKDDYDASRLVLLDLIRKFNVEGDPVALAPSRDTLLVCGSDDDDALAGMVKLAGEALKGPRPLSGFALRLDGEEWVPWLPAPEHTLYETFRMFRLQTLEHDYGAQKEMLQQLRRKAGEDVFVASFTVYEERDSGRIFSGSVWGKDVPTLLPRTDWIIFTRGPNDNKPVRTDWDRAVATLGDLMEPITVYPERYGVRDFPNEEQLKEIGTDV